jgi:hexosaminidase
MKYLHKIIIAILLIALGSCSKDKVFTENDIQIIPKPVELKLKTGVFQFSENTIFVVSDETQKKNSGGVNR